MARRLPGGDLELSDGRVLSPNSFIVLQDVPELVSSFSFGGFPASGGGGGRAGERGRAGATGPAGLPGGPTGMQGVTGEQGVTGAQGVTGLIGNTGVQGITGLGTTGVQGETGAGGGGGTKHAAEVIVDPAGGADETTIAAGLTSLAALGGGRLYLRKGAYAEGNLVMPDVDVIVNGSGRGAAIITPGAGQRAFNVPAGVTAGRQYVFEDFSVAGSSTGESYIGIGQNVNIISQRVSMTNMRNVMERTAAVDVTYTFVDSQLGLDGNASSAFNRNVIGGNTFATWTRVDADVNGNGGAFNNILSGRLNIYDSRLFGATVTASVNWTLNGEIHIDGFVANRIVLTPSGSSSTLVIINDFHTTTDGRISSSGSPVRLTNSTLLYTSINNFFEAESYIHNCLFDGGSAQATAFGVSANTVVSNCTFQNHTVRSLTVGTTRTRIHHNRFLDAVSVVEVGAGDFNLFHGNNPFPAPTIIGAASVSAQNIP